AWRAREGLADALPALAGVSLTAMQLAPWLVVVLASQVHLMLTVVLRRGLAEALDDRTAWERSLARLTPVLPAVGLLGGLLWQSMQSSPLAALWVLPALAALRYLFGEAAFGAQLSDYQDLSHRLVRTRESQNRLSNALEETRAGLQRKVDELLTLEELSVRLHQTTTVQGCMDVLLEMVGRLVNAQSIILFACEEDGFLNPSTCRSPYQDRLARARQLQLRDPRVEQAFGRRYDGPPAMNEDQALAVPMGKQGVLYVGRTGDPFSEIDRQLLTVVASNAAAALEAARRFEALESRRTVEEEEAAPALLEPGALLQNRYKLVRVIRSGGMGAVYQAEDTHLDNTACAVKQMLEHHLGTGDELLIQRKFEEEKALLARLNHPGIPRVRDFFRRGGQCYIVMDYIHGANLEQELEDCRALTGRPFAPEVLIRDMLQVLDVLVYLHELKPPVIHRDIKPANMIREFKTGRIVLVDFGLARVARSEHTQTSIGTLGYSPVEQLQGRAEPRSDLYALGVSMGQLLTGRVPVPFEFKAVREVEPQVPERLAAVVDRASAPRAADRFPDARAMRQALTSLTAP
ncbi:MAG: serine/threonine-protein kinase, partial [Candidatus Eremiobacterota bacterium]